MANNGEQLQKIFVGGLNKDADEKSLTGAFSSYGDITDVSVLRDSVGKSRGFGFVVFNDASSVDEIMQAKKRGDVFYVSGGPVEVKRALPRVDRSDLIRDRGAVSRHSVGVKKVFVGGLASTVTSVDLETYFSQYGKVLEATVLTDKLTLKSRGFGFVVFDDEDIADKVCAVRNHTISGKVSEVRKAEPRSALLNRKEKEAMNQMTFRNQGDMMWQQQMPQSNPLDVGNLNSAIQMLSSIQNLLSAAQKQQLFHQNPQIPNQGLPYGMAQYQGQSANLPVQNQMSNSNQSTILQVLQAALANQGSQGTLPNPPMMAQNSNQLSNILGNFVSNSSTNANMNALEILSSFAGIGQQGNRNVKQEGTTPQLSANTTGNSLQGASASNTSFSYYDDPYTSTSQTSSAYGPIRAPTRSETKSTQYRPY